ncbi:nucleotide exchange factor GrpE [Candidatus Fermentibacteria bacterium]|nr:nucleotide exchange factor GrpE [Candidatus Fermentibacteria bacterium]
MAPKPGDPRRRSSEPRRAQYGGRRPSPPVPAGEPARGEEDTPAGIVSLPAVEEREAMETAEEDLGEGPGEETAGESAESAETEGEASVRDALREQVLRLQAEFDNYRKRQARDFHRLCSQGKKDLIADMLVILDDFDRARKHFESGSQPSEILPGIFQTASHMAAILGKDGLEAMDLEPMMPFDPHLHEAVVAEDLPGAVQDVVLEVFRRGYTYNKEVLRPALVKVGRAPHGGESDTGLAEGGQALPQEG